MDEPVIKGFLSYHRDDDVAYAGAIDRFFRELIGQLKAESAVPVEIFRDVDSMVGGEAWRQRLATTVSTSYIFIPVVTTQYFQSSVCMEELQTFRDNTPPDELQAAVLPVVLAGHRLIKPDAAQEEIRFIESLHCRDLGEAYREGYESATWRNLIKQVVDDVITWHEGYGARHRTIRMQNQGLLVVLDDQYLEEVGLGSVPEEHTIPLLQNIYQELQMRVGEELTKDLSDEKLAEFVGFMDLDEEKMEAWFAIHVPNYRKMLDFRLLKAQLQDASDEDAMAAFGAMMWLGINRPDYPDVTAKVLAEMSQELSENSEEILKDLSDADPETYWNTDPEVLAEEIMNEVAAKIQLRTN